jgi:hypothetical protein
MGCKDEFFPSAFAIIIMSIRHSVARERVMMARSSSWLFGGTRLSWLGLRWASVVKLGWEKMECVLQGESSHAGNMKTAKNGLLVVVEHARACITTFRRFSGSKSGKARHEYVHR